MECGDRFIADHSKNYATPYTPAAYERMQASAMEFSNRLQDAQQNIRHLEVALTEKGLAVCGLRNALKEQEGEIQRHKDRWVAACHERDCLGRQVQTQKSTVTDLQQQLGVVRTQLRDAEGEIKNLKAAKYLQDERLRQMTTALFERDAQIALIHTKNEQLINVVQFQQGQLSDKDLTIFNLKKSLDTFKTKYASLDLAFGVLSSKLRTAEEALAVVGLVALYQNGVVIKDCNFITNSNLRYGPCKA